MNFKKIMEKLDWNFAIVCAGIFLIGIFIMRVATFLTDSKVIEHIQVNQNGKFEIQKKLTIDTKEVEPPDVAQVYLQAVKKMNTNSWKEAQDGFDSYIKMEGENKTAYYFIGFCIIQKNNKKWKNISTEDFEIAKDSFIAYLNMPVKTSDNFRISAAMELIYLLGHSENIEDIKEGYNWMEKIKPELTTQVLEPDQDLSKALFSKAAYFIINAYGESLEKEKLGSGLSILEELFTRIGNVNVPCEPQYMKNYFTFSLRYIQNEINIRKYEQAKKYWGLIRNKDFRYLECMQDAGEMKIYKKLKVEFETGNLVPVTGDNPKAK